MTDGSTVEGVVWLLPDSARASGFNSVEALLDGKREFIAVGLSGGGSLLVNRSCIRTVEMAAGEIGVEEQEQRNENPQSQHAAGKFAAPGRRQTRPLWSWSPRHSRRGSYA